MKLFKYACVFVFLSTFAYPGPVELHAASVSSAHFDHRLKSFSAHPASQEEHVDNTIIIERLSPGVSSDIIERYRDSLVDIYSKSAEGKVFAGRGFIVGESGYVLTNYHCVLRPKSALIGLASGTVHPVSAVFLQDVDLNITLLKIGADNLKKIVLGDSNALYIGQPVYFVQSASGEQLTLASTAIADIRYFNNLRWIALEAKIPACNNGSPLFNAKGEVVAILTFAREDGKSYACAINQIAGLIKDPSRLSAKETDDDLSVGTAYHLLQGYRNSLFGDFEQAIEAYNKVLQLDPRSASAYNNIGNAFNSLGHHQQAIVYYKRGIRIDAKIGEIYFNMGNAYAALGDNLQAINTYQKALQINDRLVEAYYNLGNVYHSIGKNDEAAAFYEKTISIDPYFLEAYYNLGNTYSAQGRYAEAVTNFGNAIKINPNNGYAYLNLALAYYSLNLHADAKSSFIRAKRIFQNQKDFRNVELIDDYIKKMSR